MNVNAALSKRSDYKWWIFGSVAIGMFISVMDQTGVNLALPRIADHFDATIPEVQWVALGYILTTGSLMLPMGRLADMIGPKRVYTTGFVIFVVAAVLTGLAPTLLTVILFKVLQGVGAAMAQATGMAIVTSAFPNEERGKAIGMFMTIVGSGAIVGPMVGGAIVGEFGWRYIFFMGVPLGIVSVIAATLVLPRAQARPASSRRLGFDWPGAVLSAGALAVFLVVMTTGYRVGWATPLVWVAFAGAVALLAAFIWWERRTSDPMLALELFRNRLFSTGIAANFLTFLGVTSIFFLMPFYLQEVLDFTPGQAGLIMAPTALTFALLGPITGRLSDRYGTRKFTITGLILVLCSLSIFSRLTAHTPLPLVMGALMLQAMGMGTFFSPNASSLLSMVERSRYGIATALLNMVRNAANVTGVGLATTIVTVIMASEGFEASLDAVRAGGGEGVKEAFTQGLRFAYLIMSGFVGLALLLTVFRSGEPGGRAAVASQEKGVPSKA